MIKLMTSYLFPSTFICISTMYIYLKIHNRNFELSFRILFTLILNILIFTVTPVLLPPFIKQMVNLFVLVLVAYFALNQDIKTAILDAIYLEIICIASEALYGTLYFIISNNDDAMRWNQSYIGIFLSNTVIPIIMTILNNTKLFNYIYKKLNSIVKYIRKDNVFFVIIMFFTIVNFLLYGIHYIYYFNKSILFLMIILIIFLYTITLFVILNTSNKYEKMKSKYTLSLENIKGYEEMLNQYRVSSHESKNQLLLIRNMVKDKETKKYIDKLINNKEKDDNNIYNLVKRIPSSSIRAVIYSKVLLMSNKNISYSIKIGRKISLRDFDKLSSSLTLDICNILNVFLDNAIEEVANIPKKQVLVEFNKVNDEIEIIISNLCSRNVNLNQIYNMGYSTKGDNHGYGLVIVKKTINSNLKILRNVTDVSNGVFTQYLYIKIK